MCKNKNKPNRSAIHSINNCDTAATNSQFALTPRVTGGVPFPGMARTVSARLPGIVRS